MLVPAGGVLPSDRDFHVNRSAGSIHIGGGNRSQIGMASLDRSAVLQSAQSFFKSKGGKAQNMNGISYLGDASFNSSLVLPR